MHICRKVTFLYEMWGLPLCPPLDTLLRQNIEYSAITNMLFGSNCATASLNSTFLRILAQCAPTWFDMVLVGPLVTSVSDKVRRKKPFLFFKKNCKNSTAIVNVLVVFLLLYIFLKIFIANNTGKNNAQTKLE